MKITRKYLLFTQMADEVKPRCRDYPDYFYPEDWGEDYEFAKAWAQKICNACPIKDLCLEYALEADEEFGIWGGKTAASRKYGRG